MFKVDDLKSKVSEFKLGEIIEVGPTPDDYCIPDDYEDEIKTPISIRVNDEIVRASRHLMNKYDCSSNILYKSATKLGAMIMSESREIKILSDISYIFDLFFDRAQELGDYKMVEILYEYTEKMSESSNFSFGRYVSKKKIYPYPKWRIILNKFAYNLSTTVSNVYRIAIILSFSTEIKLKSSEELFRVIYINQRKRLSALQDFCSVVKHYVRLSDYLDYIKKAAKRNISEEVVNSIKILL